MHLKPWMWAVIALIVSQAVFWTWFETEIRPLLRR
jgi:hypothetical protein